MPSLADLANKHNPTEATITPTPSIDLCLDC